MVCKIELQYSLWLNTSWWNEATAVNTRLYSAKSSALTVQITQSINPTVCFLVWKFKCVLIEFGSGGGDLHIYHRRCSDPSYLRRARWHFPFSPKLEIRSKICLFIKAATRLDSSAASLQRVRPAAPTIVHSGRMTVEVKRIFAAAATGKPVRRQERTAAWELCGWADGRERRCAISLAKKKERKKRESVAKSPCSTPEDANCSVIPPWKYYNNG